MFHPSSNASSYLAICCVAILGTCAPSFAQNFQNLEPSVGHHGALVSPGADTVQEGRWIPRLTVSIADQPLVSRAPDQSVNDVFIDGQTGVDLGMAWGAMDNLEIGLNMPFGVVRGDGLTERDGEGFALGDLRLGVKWRLTHSGAALGIAPDLWLAVPTGNQERLYGAQGASIRPGINLSAPVDDALLMSRFGFRFFTEEERLANVAQVNDFHYSFAALVDTDWPSVSVLAEIFGSVPMESADDADTSHPAEAVLGLIFRSTPVEITAGSGFAVNAEPGVPNHRVFLSLAFVPEEPTEFAEDEPIDSSGIDDAEDRPDDPSSSVDPMSAVSEASETETDDTEDQPDDLGQTDTAEPDQANMAQDSGEPSGSMVNPTEPETSEANKQTETVEPKADTPSEEPGKEPKTEASDGSKTVTMADEKSSTKSEESETTISPEDDARDVSDIDQGQPSTAVHNDVETSSTSTLVRTDPSVQMERDAPEEVTNDPGPPSAPTQTPSVPVQPERSHHLDHDLDGIPDAQDACRDMAEDKDGFDDDDGCPDDDNDGDGIKDTDDSCPDTAGTAAQSGCPDPVTPPADAVPSSKDVRNSQADEPEEDMAPEKDETDAAGDNEMKDETESSSDQSPSTSVASAESVMVDLARQIIFEREKTRLTAQGITALRSLIETMQDRLGTDILVVQGHAYMRSTKKWNVTLASRRAESVHDYLVTHGLSEDRVVFVGLGDAGPSAERVRNGDGHITFALVSPESAPYLIEGVTADETDTLRLTFEVSRTVSASDVTVSTDGRDVFLVRMNGAQVARQWVTLKDPDIKRALIHPSTESPPAGVLRVRTRSEMPVNIDQRAEIVVEDDRVHVVLPRWSK